MRVNREGAAVSGSLSVSVFDLLGQKCRGESNSAGAAYNGGDHVYHIATGVLHGGL
jgi:hypothetical protein